MRIARLLWLLALCPALARAQGAAPPLVLVSPVKVANVAPAYSYIGRVQAIQAVQLVPRVTAFIDEEPTPQGSEVKKGQVLFELQKAEYAAALASARAQLASANAALANAQLQYQRAAQLRQQGFEAQADLDTATATRNQDQANVQAAEAAVAQAALNLQYCTIASPIDGRVGVYTLTPGNLVTPSTSALTSVIQEDPIRVVFSVADRQLVRLQQQTGASVQQVAAGLTLELALPDGTPYKQTGQIRFFNNQVDPQTGTISIYADFANPDRLLVAGGFVTVNVRSSKPQQAPLVPVAAIQNDQSGSSVLVVGADNKVEQRKITVGRQIGQDDIVTSGLTGGEQVVVEGMQKIKPGQTVNAQPAPPPPSASSGNNAEAG